MWFSDGFEKASRWRILERQRHTDLEGRELRAFFSVCALVQSGAGAVVLFEELEVVNGGELHDVASVHVPALVH